MHTDSQPNKELKLVFADQNLSDAVFELLSTSRPIGNYCFEPLDCEDIRDLYFDTPSRELQRKSASLRLRRRNNAVGELQIKQAEGRISVEMNYRVVSCFHDWDAQTTNVTPDESVTNEIRELKVNGDIERIGAIHMTRKRVRVLKSGSEVALVCLDRFRIGESLAASNVESAEIEVKGSDANDVLYLGESLANWFGLIKVTTSKLDRHLPIQGRAKRLLLDMDPGVDDSLALLYLLASPDRPVIDGITIVGGNVPVRDCARNAFRILRWAFEKGILTTIPPIGIGVDLSCGKMDAANVHGIDGMGGLDWGEIDQDFESFALADACELQRQVLAAHPGEVTIVATGPCSNLARLVDEHPDVARKTREIVVMGGAFFDCGNRGPMAEFNIHSDSRAARRLLEYCRTKSGCPEDSIHVPLTFVGLDVTHRVILERAAIASMPGEMGQLAARISAHYMDFYRSVLGIDGCPLHDPLAMAVALRSELVVREPYHVEIVSTPSESVTDGITIADHRPCSRFKEHDKEVTQVCVSVNNRAFLDDFLSRFENAL